MNRSKINFMYQSAYQMLLILLPFIVAPYISRVMGKEGVGIYSYVSSVTAYFSLAIMLGIDVYGSREAARLRDDRERLQQFFCNIMAVHLAIGFIVLVCYALYVNFAVSNNQQIFAIHTLSILASIVDINWFFWGLEKFKLTVIRNVVIKLLTVLSVFMFVKTAADIWVYTLIMGLGTFLSQLVLWCSIRKYISFVKPDLKIAFKYLRPMLVLFIPSIAISVYKQMDKIMLGTMKSFSETGIYDYSERIINAPLGLITAMGTVMLPAMSHLYASKKTQQIQDTITKSMKFMLFLSAGCTAGLFAISKDFIPLFYGKDFEGCVSVICILSLSIPFIAWANVIRTQYLLPSGRDKLYITSILIGAILNFVINVCLIPVLGARGAAYGTLATEMIICIVQTVAAYKVINIWRNTRDVLRFGLSAILMAILVKMISRIEWPNKSLLVIGEVVVGIVTYLMMNIKYCMQLIEKKH